VLSTNTNFLSIHYRNACGSPADGDPAKATLAWLEAELAAAKEAQERVWLVYTSRRVSTASRRCGEALARTQ
jgi:hypothetical protein